MSIDLRKAEIGDLELFFELYLDSRVEEMRSWGWAPEQMRQFARMQYMSRQMAYSAQYPQADDQVIVFNGAAIGRLLVYTNGEEIRLIDIAILTEQRGKGFGKQVLERLLHEADQASVRVILHVEMSNPAKNWYERAGFQVTGENGGYYLMTRQPAALS